jgi:hypothetical protein
METAAVICPARLLDSRRSTKPRVPFSYRIQGE